LLSVPFILYTSHLLYIYIYIKEIYIYICFFFGLGEVYNTRGYSIEYVCMYECIHTYTYIHTPYKYICSYICIGTECVCVCVCVYTEIDLTETSQLGGNYFIF
jgi:hypothetical protein